MEKEQSQARFIKRCIRKQIAEETKHETIRDEGHPFIVYSPQHDLSFILHQNDSEYELLGMCKGEMDKDLAMKYAGQFKVKK